MTYAHACTRLHMTAVVAQTPAVPSNVAACLQSCNTRLCPLPTLRFPSLLRCCNRVPEVCAQLGLPAEQIMSEKGPFLALSVALLAAPTAFTWLFHKGSSAAMQHLARKAAAAQHSAASVLTSGVQRAGPNMDVVGQGELSDADAQQQQQQTAGGVSWQRMSYSVLPLVWAGRGALSLATSHCARLKICTACGLL